MIWVKTQMLYLIMRFRIAVGLLGEFAPVHLHRGRGLREIFLIPHLTLMWAYAETVSFARCALLELSQTGKLRVWLGRDFYHAKGDPS